MPDPTPTPRHHRQRTWRAGAGLRSRAVEGAFTVALVLVVGLLLLIAPEGRWASPGLVACLLLAASVASAVRFEVGGGWNSPMQLAQVPLWLAVPPAWLAPLVGLSLITGQLLENWRTGGDRRGWRMLLAADDAWHAVGAAVALTIVGQPEATIDALPALCVVFLAQVGVDTIYGVLHGRVVLHAPLPDLLRSAGWVTLIDAALFPVGFLAAFATAQEPWLALSLVPLIGLFAEFAREREARVSQSLELSGAYRGTAQLMATVLSHDDAYTGGEHTRGVVDLAVAVGQQLRLGPDRMRQLEFGALLHDIGKLQIPKEIINKPGKLTEEEWELIREHPAIGQAMLDTVGGALAETGRIVRAHHERFDGGGYPDGLMGSEIPFEARVIAVCDSYSAMTTDRPYRAAMTIDEAVAELDRCTGTQFDPTVVEAIRAVLATGGPRLTVAPAPAPAGPRLGA